MILVTGGSGFLGHHLVQSLSAQGRRVRALYHANEPGKGLAGLAGIEWMKCDLLDVYDVEAAMAGIDEIYHCAAMVTFNPGKRDEMLHFNPESTANVVNQALEQGIRKLVHVSSVAALGRTGDSNKLIDEEQEWGESRYNSAYGISKYLAENEVWRGIGEGLCAVVVNPSVILGSGDWSKGSAQLMKVANGEFPFYTRGVTGWVDVADVVTVMQLLMASEIESERFIVNAANLPFREVFTMMAEALNKKPPRVHAGSFITGIVWRMSVLYSKIAGSNPAITRETATNARSLSLYNADKLKGALPGFSFTAVKDTIKQMAQAFSNDENKRNV